MLLGMVVKYHEMGIKLMHVLQILLNVFVLGKFKFNPNMRDMLCPEESACRTRKRSLETKDYVLYWKPHQHNGRI